MLFIYNSSQSRYQSPFYCHDGTLVVTSGGTTAMTSSTPATGKFIEVESIPSVHAAPGRSELLREFARDNIFDS